MPELQKNLHQFRNSLEVIKNHLYLLSMDYPDVAASPSMQALDAEVQKLASLFNSDESQWPRCK